MKARLSRIVAGASIPLFVVWLCALAFGQETTRNRDRSSQVPHQMLTHRANVLLAGSGALAGADIKVTINGAEVTLDGVVADRDARERALSMVRRMRGVRGVIDRLRIDPALSAARVSVEDGELSMGVAQALSREFFPDARLAKESRYSWEIDGGEWEIEVTADAGDIILTGEAPTPKVIDELIARARRIRGVRSVRSALSAATFYRPAGDFPDWGYHPYPFRVPWRSDQ